MKKNVQQFSFRYDHDDVLITARYVDLTNTYEITFEPSSGWLTIEEFKSVVQFLNEVVKDLENRPDVVKLFGG